MSWLLTLTRCAESTWPDAHHLYRRLYVLLGTGMMLTSTMGEASLRASTLMDLLPMAELQLRNQGRQADTVWWPLFSW